MDYFEDEDEGIYPEVERGEEEIFDEYEQMLKEQGVIEEEKRDEFEPEQQEEQEFEYSFQQIVSANKSSSSSAVYVGRRRIISDEERFEKEVSEILEEEDSIVKFSPKDKKRIAEKLESLLPESRFYNIRIFARAYLFVQKNGKDFTPEEFKTTLKLYKKAKKMIPEDFLRYCLIVAEKI
ncbi:hypothetical protein GMAR_ORF131 [Golden Marseillevirus]|uniref:hypothetical protein n=1 Tax=Golden Marseillevirus TaxID=1720526 RepID=UPI000877AAF7|nr:hypothetical protein GMAR_ORF131 [Golden Marseillevirus]ALX27505.1 hypothetical protein GMAR_ORF131 [Golden Marseillevirus]